MIHPVATASAPKALGPYSQGIRAGQLLFVSGQVPVDPATGELVDLAVREIRKRGLQKVVISRSVPIEADVDCPARS